MAEVKDYFTDAGTLDRQEFGNLFASSIHLHDDTACGRATLLQCLDTRYWPSPMPLIAYRRQTNIADLVFRAKLYPNIPHPKRKVRGILDLTNLVLEQSTHV